MRGGTYNIPTFRKTRSGKSFSPWDTDFGEPIHAPEDFELNKQIQRAVERDLLRASLEGTAAGEDEDDLPLEDVRDRRQEARGLTINDHSVKLFQMNGPASASPPNGEHLQITDAISKEKYHAKKRAKACRLKKRSAPDAAGAAGVAKRVVKDVAKKRRAAALALKLGASLAVEPDVAAALTTDSRTTVTTDAEPLKTDFSLSKESVPVAKTAFVGKRKEQTAADREEVTKDELLRAGYEYVPWDGRQCRPILDKSDRVFAVLAGRPRDASWDSINGELQKLFDITRDAYQLSSQQVSHRRGPFSAITCGISYGGGQQRVANLAQRGQNAAVLDALIKQAAVRRVANFGNRAFQLFAPRMYDYYEETMNALYQKDSTLRPNFSNNVFGAATFNLGPRTISYTHRDHLNLPWGWCSITAIGDFDPVRGGHLVLHDLRMVIEFPPGSTILIPSAILSHSNTSIAPEEHRYSFTQYSAGGLFRWVEYKFQPAKNVRALSAKQAEADGAARWERGLGMLSRWEDLQG
ncbi:hypothetical protein ACG7TL_006359 [Trametes sanguinea]